MLESQIVGCSSAGERNFSSSALKSLVTTIRVLARSDAQAEQKLTIKVRRTQHLIPGHPATPSKKRCSSLSFPGSPVRRRTSMGMRPIGTPGHTASRWMSPRPISAPARQSPSAGEAGTSLSDALRLCVCPFTLTAERGATAREGGMTQEKGWWWSGRTKAPSVPTSQWEAA